MRMRVNVSAMKEGNGSECVSDEGGERGVRELCQTLKT